MFQELDGAPLADETALTSWCWWCLPRLPGEGLGGLGLMPKGVESLPGSAGSFLGMEKKQNFWYMKFLLMSLSLGICLLI